MALVHELQSALGHSYNFERELAGGGMSRVFVAEETRLGRKVAIKVLPPEIAESLKIERFTRENGSSRGSSTRTSCRSSRPAKPAAYRITRCR